jgi:hypothetical protein
MAENKLAHSRWKYNFEDTKLLVFNRLQKKVHVSLHNNNEDDQNITSKIVNYQSSPNDAPSSNFG